MVEVMRRDFNEQHMMQVPITENQLEEIANDGRSFRSCGIELLRDA